MLVYLSTLLFLLSSLPVSASESPKGHQLQLQDFFLDRAPAIPLSSYSDDYYRIDKNISRSGLPLFNQQAQNGKKLLSSDFSNGKNYSYCFRSGGIGIASDYPQFDVLSGQVKTLAMNINECREENAEYPYRYEGTEIKNMLIYMNNSSRKNITNIIIPNDPTAEEAFEKGKKFFFSRRGQLDMACAHCHIDNSDKRYGTLQIPPALGLPMRMPRYDSANQKTVTLHERFNECLSYTKAKPFPLQSEEFRNLEFYLFYISNTLPLNAPSVK